MPQNRLKVIPANPELFAQLPMWLAFLVMMMRPRDFGGGPVPVGPAEGWGEYLSSLFQGGGGGGGSGGGGGGGGSGAAGDGGDSSKSTSDDAGDGDGPDDTVEDSSTNGGE